MRVGQARDRWFSSTRSLQFVYWPAHIRQFERLTPRISLTALNPPLLPDSYLEQARSVNHLLYSLARVLHTSDILENIDVPFAGDEQLQQAHVQMMLWPLNRFNICGRTVKVTGVSADVASKVLESSEKCDPGLVCNLRSRYRLINSMIENHKVQAVTKAMYLSKSENVARLEHRLHHLVEGNAVVDGRWEADLLETMRLAEVVLGIVIGDGASCC